MAFARDTYTATASQTDFTITFPYITETHVKVFVNGTEIDNDADADTSSFQIVTAGTVVRVGAGLTAGDVVVVLRNSSRSARIVDYANASTITETDLDNDSLQAFYMVQEAIDAAATALGLGSTELWDATSIRITNVGTPTADADAATKAYVDSVLTTLGDIPVPSASKDLLVATGATAGSYAWATALDTATQIADDLIDSQHLAAGGIDTEHLGDNQVSLAKLAHGTQGGLLYFAAAGVPTELAAGTSGQVLQTQGAGANPQWASVSSVSKTNSGLLDLTNGGADDLTLLALLSSLSNVQYIHGVFSDVSLNAANTPCLFQLGTSGGYVSSGYVSQGYSQGAQADAVTDGFQHAESTLYDAASIGDFGFELFHMGSNVWKFSSQGMRDSATSPDFGVGYIALAGALTQIRVTTSTGTATFDGGGGYVSTLEFS